MRFRILGPLVVEADGVAVEIGGPKPRALLAALLVHRGTVVSADRLIEALWGDEPPEAALGALRAYVSRLRPAVGGANRLRYRAPGYVLVAVEGELDAAEFERLVGEARAAVEAGAPKRALGLVDAALAFWRGEALAEFADLDFARAEAARLDELRLGALEDRLDALVRLGHDAAAIAEAEPLARRHPTRERTVTALMRALYAAGRQADALTAYDELRRRLADELGVDPLEPTRALYQRILAQDPGLLEVAARGNLQRRGTSFVGREVDVVTVLATLADAPLVTLIGVGGVGKTRIAEQVADRAQADFRDGAWLCELAPLAEGGPVDHVVSAALGVQQQHGLTMHQTVIEYLRTRRLLLVLDNCEHVLDAAALLVDALVRQCPGITVLATSREQLGVEGERLWPVGPLPAPDAGALFLARARDHRPDFAPGTDDADSIATICSRVDRLPLGIELAAARIRSMSAAEIAGRLDGGGTPAFLTGTVRTAQPRHQSMDAAVDWSYQLLSEPEQFLFARLSVFAGGADLPAVHAVCGEVGTGEDETLDLLTRLVEKSMVAAEGSSERTRYRVLETMRSYGRRVLSYSGEHSGARHAVYFTELAERGAAGVQGTDEQGWVKRILPDYGNVRAAFEHTAAAGDGELALRLVTALSEVTHLRIGYEGSDWAERTLAFAPPDHPLIDSAIGVAARGAWNRGEFGHARTLAIRSTARPPRGTGRVAYPGDVLADLALYTGEPAAALAHYLTEADHARAAADPIRLVWTLYYVAICHAVRRSPELGLAAAQESVAVADPTGNPTAQSMARYALGLVLKKSEPDRALVLFDEAAELATSVRNFWWAGIALMEAAATRAVHRDAATAACAFVGVLDHWDRVGDWTNQWLNLRYVIRLLVRLGADDDAVLLHHVLAAAGRPSPLDDATVERLSAGYPAEDLAARGARLSPADAVTLAKTALLRRS